jgi:alpha-1,3-glucan synthase
MPSFHCCLFLAVLSCTALALEYTEDQVPWNLNQNANAQSPVEYWGEWENHTFNPSPDNWRFPTYILTIDRFVDGDPTNNNANHSSFEHDWMSTQFRSGGDARGLMNHLDYIQGTGIKVCHYQTLVVALF